MAPAFRLLHDPCSYLVFEMLCGRRFVVDAVYMYYVVGVNISEISRYFGASKGSVMYWVSEFRKKVGSKHVSRGLAASLCRRVAGVKPIVVDGVCTLCGSRLGKGVGVTNHVIYNHYQVVEKVVMEVCRQ